MVVGVVLVGFDERQVLVAFGARNHIQFEVGAQPVQVAVVYAEDVALQLERCGVDGQRTVEDALNHNLPLLLHGCLVEVLVSGEQQHVAVAGLLNLYHLHVLRNLLQLVIHLIVVVGILVVEIEPVVHVANPQIAVAVVDQRNHFPRGHVGLLSAARHKRHELIAVERAEPVPCAKPEEAVLVFQRAIHGIAGQSFFQRVVLHNHTVLGMNGHPER